MEVSRKYVEDRSLWREVSVGGRKQNLTSCIKKRVASFPSNTVMRPKPPANQQGASEAQIAQAVSAKLEDGNLGQLSEFIINSFLFIYLLIKVQ